MDFFGTAFSTFLGAAVALAADRLTKMQEAKLTEEAAVNSLILDLAAKRAFLVGPDWDWAPGEVKRVVDSVHHTRTLVRDARVALTPRSRYLPALREMSRACNVFLELSERDDDERLKSALQRLSDDLRSQVAALHGLRPDRIYPDSPGSFALDPPL